LHGAGDDGPLLSLISIVFNQEKNVSIFFTPSIYIIHFFDTTMSRQLVKVLDILCCIEEATGNQFTALQLKMLAAALRRIYPVAAINHARGIAAYDRLFSLVEPAGVTQRQSSKTFIRAALAAALLCAIPAMKINVLISNPRLRPVFYHLVEKIIQSIQEFIDHELASANVCITENGLVLQCANMAPPRQCRTHHTR